LFDEFSAVVHDEMGLFGRGLFFVAVAEERGWFAEDGGTVIDVVPIFSMHCQAAFEISKIFLLGIRPQHLTQGRHSGHDHVFNVFWA
jgi:hypothetical protein